jgi:hypothetical protein
MISKERRPAPLPTGRPTRDMLFVSLTEHHGDKLNLTELQAKRLVCRFNFAPPTARLVASLAFGEARL